MSQPGKQTIAIHLLPNISRSKGNQKMKFGQLIEYNMRNIFLEKSYTKCSGETFLRPFSKNKNWAYLWISVIQFIFIVSQAEAYQNNILKLSADHFLLPHLKLFQKSRFETSLPGSFST